MVRTKNGLGSPYNGNGSLTREQFLIFETRTVAKLMSEDQLSDEKIVEKVLKENLFQYPTERTLKNLATVCIKRLRAMNNEKLVAAIAGQPVDVAKQICLYAMMKQYHLIWDFMINVIGAKFSRQDFNFSRADINVFFLQLQEQDDLVASWSDSTVERMKLVLLKILVETEYIDHYKTDHLNPVMLSSLLENEIKNNGDQIVLPAFNCFW